MLSFSISIDSSHVFSVILSKNYKEIQHLWNATRILDSAIGRGHYNKND